MNDLLQKIDSYRKLSGYELAYKHIYEHKIPLDQLDYSADFLKEAFSVDLDKYSMEDMLREFKNIAISIVESTSLTTKILIPKNRWLFVRQWPRYMPDITHYHEDAMEIMCLLNGEIAPVINNTPVQMHPGDMCFVAPNTLHSLYVPNDNVVAFSIILYAEALREVLENIKLESGILSDFLHRILYGREYIPFLFCETNQDPLIAELVMDMTEMQNADDPCSDSYLRTALELICLRISKKYKSSITASNAVLKNNARISSVIHYAENNYATVTLRELSEKFNYSPNYLSALIKQCYGHTFNEILTDIRLTKSLTLLKQPDHTVFEISEMLGYSDSSYFFKLFKKRYHMTPAEYRRQAAADLPIW